MQEYYIRKSEDSDARGPFSMEQLSSLAETGQVDVQTAYYDVEREEWLPIATNESLRAALFPEKKKLKVKPKELVSALNAPDEAGGPASKPITVTEMLDAAEGLTSDSKIKANVTVQDRTRGASFGMQFCALLLLLHAFCLGVAERDVILGPDLMAIFTRPLAYAAFVDLALGVVLFLGVAEAYPVVRIRAAAMVGFLTVSFLGVGNPEPLVASAVASCGIYALTHFTRLAHVIAATVLGLGGVAWMALAVLKL